MEHTWPLRANAWSPHRPTACPFLVKNCHSIGNACDSTKLACFPHVKEELFTF